MKLPVFYAFARSGGTLLNRCIGCISGNLVLSEVNPHASVMPIEQQARDWLHLLTEDQYSDFAQKSYGNKIAGLTKLAHKRGNYLVLRDWVTANFFASIVPRELSIDSSLILEQDCYLSRYGFECRPAVMTRRAADVYESITRTFNHATDLTVEAFGVHYLAYAKAVYRYPIFHYEQLCQEPAAIVSQICQTLEINYDESFIDRFSQFTNCTGDTTLSQFSRGGQLEVIKPLKSNSDAPSYIAASQNEHCQKADELLNYAD